jgi:hypothetical protein
MSPSLSKRQSRAVAKRPPNAADMDLLVRALLLIGERLGVAVARGIVHPGDRDVFIVEAGEEAIKMLQVWADETGVDLRAIVTAHIAERLAERGA